MESHVFHRDSRKTYAEAVGGSGCWLFDRKGKRYLDACGGAAVSALGHQHPTIIQAMHTQIDKLAYAHTSFFSSEPAEQLADKLVGSAPFFGSDPNQRLDRVYFVSSGSESIEAALKLARQVAIERGEAQRTVFLARRQSYHGNTLGALSVGGNAWRREPFKDLLMPAEHVDACYEYRGRAQGESLNDYSNRLVKQFEDKILELGPSRVLAFVVEPVVGATLGAVPPTPDYFRGIREICSRYGILLILDEVMCGMGRTGSLFAYEQEAIDPDMVCIAKGLGGGYQPIAALMVSKSIHESIVNGSGFFQHGHTYLGHPIACATALAVLGVFSEENVLAEAGHRSRYFFDALHQAFDGHPNVGDIRGRGLFLGLELVADKGTKAPFPPSHKLHAVLKSTALENGLMCYPMGGTIDGRHGDHVLLAPPLVISNLEIDQAVSMLTASLEQALRDSRATQGS
ncbi:MAG: aspartate aminotransferase family protein [Burkholderiaceae bacterium]